MTNAFSTAPQVPAVSPPAGELVPKPPIEATPDVLEAAEHAAARLAEQVAAAPGDLELLSRLTRIGEDAQHQVGAFFERRRVSVADMMRKVGDGSQNPLPDQIRQMQEVMEKFDPRPFREQLALSAKYGGKGLKNTLLRNLKGVPLLGDLIRRIADRFVSINDEIQGVLLAMEKGMVRLDENNAAILAQSDELKRLIAQVELRAYESELVFRHLKAKMAAAAEEDRQKLLNAMSRVSKRALFLRSNEQIFLQVLTGLRTSITTSFELRDTVSMLRDQAGPLLTNLYALLVVQQEGRQIAEAASATQERVVDLLRSGAELTADNVEYVGRLSVKMASEMEELLASKETFLEAVAKADQIAAQTVAAAARSIPMLQEASDQLRKVVQDQEAADALSTGNGS